MLQQLTARCAASPGVRLRPDNAQARAGAARRRHARVGCSAQRDIGMLRGVTPAAADTAECTCPEPCERDHANE